MYAGDLRLWAGTLRGTGLGRRIAAAGAAGFTSVSLAPTEYVAARAAGESDADLRAAAAAAGVRLATVDPLVAWLPGRGSAAPVAHRPFLEFAPGAVVQIAEAVGAESISVFDPGEGPLDPDRAAEALAGVCDLAAGAGLRVNLEFQVYSGIADVRAAREILRRAGRSNAGLVIDAWHLHHSGRALPGDLPADAVSVVQLADAGPFDKTTRRVSLHDRLLPGTGRADLLGLVRRLRALGASPSYGVEVFSDTLAALAPELAARLAARCARAVLDAAATRGQPARAARAAPSRSSRRSGRSSRRASAAT